MAGRGNIKNLTPFKPGQSGNPAGRAGVLPPEIRAERKKNQAALIRTITEYFLMTDKDAKARAKTAEATQLEKAVQALILSARGGEVVAFKFLIELMVGKIPEHDYDGFTEEDLRILNRVKEVFAEQGRTTNDTASEPVGTGH